SDPRLRDHGHRGRRRADRRRGARGRDGVARESEVAGVREAERKRPARSTGCKIYSHPYAFALDSVTLLRYEMGTLDNWVSRTPRPPRGVFRSGSTWRAGRGKRAPTLDRQRRHLAKDIIIWL